MSLTILYIIYSVKIDKRHHIKLMLKKITYWGEFKKKRIIRNGNRNILNVWKVSWLNKI